jgi:hypothetical protein
MTTISIAKDFTRFPAGRFKAHGNTSGEGFRQKLLEGPLSRGEQVVVDLDGTIGYGSSFLEEAFGGLVRSLRMPGEDIWRLLRLRSSDPSLITEIQEYILSAQILPSKSTGTNG